MMLCLQLKDIKQGKKKSKKETNSIEIKEFNHFLLTIVDEGMDIFGNCFLKHFCIL